MEAEAAAVIGAEVEKGGEVKAGSVEMTEVEVEAVKVPQAGSTAPLRVTEIGTREENPITIIGCVL